MKGNEWRMFSISQKKIAMLPLWSWEVACILS